MKGRFIMRTFAVLIFVTLLFFLGNGARPNEQVSTQVYRVLVAKHTVSTKNWLFLRVPVRSLTYANKPETYVFWKKKHLLVYFSPLARKHHLQDMFATGFQQWDAALDYKLSYSETPFAQNADIDIAIERSHGKYDTTLGVTEMEPDYGHCPLRHAKIRIRWGFANIKGTLVHELGHALGITDHSDAISDLMWPDEQGCTQPSKRDLLTLRYMYAQF